MSVLARLRNVPLIQFITESAKKLRRSVSKSVSIPLSPANQPLPREPTASEGLELEEEEMGPPPGLFPPGLADTIEDEYSSCAEEESDLPSSVPSPEPSRAAVLLRTPASEFRVCVSLGKFDFRSRKSFASRTVRSRVENEERADSSATEEPVVALCCSTIQAVRSRGR